jgi:hypothetical protein
MNSPINLKFLMSCAALLVLSEIICNTLLIGRLGQFVSFVDRLFIACCMLYEHMKHFGYFLLKVRQPKLRENRDTDATSKVMAKLPESNIKFPVSIVNHSKNGLGLVSGTPLSDLKRGMYLCVDGKAYRIVWKKKFGSQYHMGLLHN